MNKIEKNVRKLGHFLDNDPQTAPLPQKSRFDYVILMMHYVLKRMKN